jgi:hypothetical protein
MSEVRIQNSEFRALHLNSEFCILTSDIFAVLIQALVHHRLSMQFAA